MTEEVVSFEVAKLAKEKGFDWNCRYTYNSKGGKESSIDWTGNDTFSKEDIENSYNNGHHDYLAPTQSLLQRWLREVHKIEIRVELMSDFHNKDQYYPELGYIYDVLCFTKEEDGKVLRDIISSSGAPTYEKALDLALYVGLGFIDSPFRRKNKLV